MLRAGEDCAKIGTGNKAKKAHEVNFCKNVCSSSLNLMQEENSMEAKVPTAMFKLAIEIILFIDVRLLIFHLVQTSYTMQF